MTAYFELLTSIVIAVVGPSTNDFMQDAALAIDLGQSLFEALEIERQPRVVDPQEMYNRCMQIADLDASYFDSGLGSNSR